MQQLNRAITTMLFAAHALLGCCAHHACGSGLAAYRGVAACEAEHHDSGHHNHPADDGTSHESGEEGDRVPGPCHHDTCSFVKIQPVRVDHGGGQILWVASALPAVSLQADAGSPTQTDAGFPLSTSAAHLYMRFCALLI